MVYVLDVGQDMHHALLLELALGIEVEMCVVLVP